MEYSYINISTILWMKRTHKEVAKSILMALKDGQEHSYGDLERKANTNWKTIRDHIEYLRLFGAVEISDKNKIKITGFGIKISKKV